MKKYIYLLGLVCLSVVVVVSCTDEDLTRLDDLQKGAFVKHETAPAAVVGANSIEELVYETTLINPDGNVVSFELYVYGKLASVGTTDTGKVGLYTEFPIKLNLKAEELATLVGEKISSIDYGDEFSFIGIATDANGVKYSYETPKFLDDTVGADSYDAFYTKDSIGNINDTVYYYYPGGRSNSTLVDATTGYRNGFNFSFAIGCPSSSFNAESLAGTYKVEEHEFDAYFGDQGSTREIKVGPGENQFTIVGGAIPLSGGSDLIFEVDLETNEVSYAGDSDAIHFNTITYASVSGYMFFCAGAINLTISSDGIIDNILILTKE